MVSLYILGMFKDLSAAAPTQPNCILYILRLGWRCRFLGAFIAQFKKHWAIPFFSAFIAQFKKRCRFLNWLTPNKSGSAFYRVYRPISTGFIYNIHSGRCGSCPNVFIAQCFIFRQVSKYKDSTKKYLYNQVSLSLSILDLKGLNLEIF